MVNLLIHKPVKAELAETSFGGKPVQNSAEEFNWPECAYCELPMQFLGKIKSGNYLYQIFMCQNEPGCCEEWGADDGGNKVIVTEAVGLEVAEVPSEGVTTRDTEYSAVTVAVQSEKYNDARVSWAEEHDNKYRDVLGQINGEPAWLQGDDTPDCDECSAPMQFLAQLETGPDMNTEMNFGGGGVAYVFKCNCKGSAKFLWQC